MNKDNCIYCASRFTPLCKDCTVISFPSGRESIPSRYIKFGNAEVAYPIYECDGGEVSEIVDAVKHPEKIGLELLGDIIAGCVERGSTIPLAVVIEYNNRFK